MKHFVTNITILLDSFQPLCLSLVLTCYPNVFVRPLVLLCLFCITESYSALNTTKNKSVLCSKMSRWSALAEGAVDPPRQVGDGSRFDKALEEFSLSVHVVHLLLQHGTHRQVVIVVQWRPLL